MAGIETRSLSSSDETVCHYMAPDIVFVGINPGECYDRVGHCVARNQNSFWTA